MGQSGDSVQIIPSGKFHVVRKMRSENSDSRLEYQYQKHLLALAEKKMDPFKAPKILENFDGSGYSMELLHGVPLGAAIRTMSNSETTSVIDGFTSYFSRLFDGDSSIREVPQALVLAKLGELEGKYESFEDGTFSATALKAIEEIRVFLSGSSVPYSWNHGDFSFENILVSRKAKSLFVVDFLDSPFDTYWLDIGRLWLDLSNPWWGSGFRQPAVSRINQLAIMDGLRPVFETQSFSPRSLNLLASFSALRILPYTSNPVRKAALKLAVRSVVSS